MSGTAAGRRNRLHAHTCKAGCTFTARSTHIPRLLNAFVDLVNERMDIDMVRYDTQCSCSRFSQSVVRRIRQQIFATMALLMVGPQKKLIAMLLHHRS